MDGQLCWVTCFQTPCICFPLWADWWSQGWPFPLFTALLLEKEISLVKAELWYCAMCYTYILVLCCNCLSCSSLFFMICMELLWTVLWHHMTRCIPLCKFKGLRVWVAINVWVATFVFLFFQTLLKLGSLSLYDFIMPGFPYVVDKCFTLLEGTNIWNVHLRLFTFFYPVLLVLFCLWFL